MHPDAIQALRMCHPAIYGSTLRTKCGDGWFGILDALGEQLARQAELAHRPATKIRMSKEKFGALQLGITAQTVAVAAGCEPSITMSARVREVCGFPENHFGTLVRCAMHLPDPRSFCL
ncbi:hypothetical protein [Pseudomonas sp. Q2-TVG4-2]|uniref:hypothetical protein n=1 Tax=Pseudomonas sp. Q2-TVG4-2 TaxID=1685699 RepID=UPI0015E7B60C|nr:hypothetical protein [Pseudomonas sp. Q2-TVG4-2]